MGGNGNLQQRVILDKATVVQSALGSPTLTEQLPGAHLGITAVPMSLGRALNSHGQIHPCANSSAALLSEDNS